MDIFVQVQEIYLLSVFMCGRLYLTRAKDDFNNVFVRMNFRQRVAWLLLAIYLVSTAGALYYMFQISMQLRMFALDHVDRVHTVAASPLRPPVQHNGKPGIETSPSIVASCLTFVWSMLGHIVDIPGPVLVILIFIVYMQVCCYQRHFKNNL